MNAEQKLLSEPLERLLVSGGDTRSAIDAQTGLNSFGCSPLPRPEAFSFGSCTASSISCEAFRRVEQERDALLALSSHSRLLSRPDLSFHSNLSAANLSSDLSSLHDLLDEKTQWLRDALRQMLAPDQRDVEIVFSPSGTDATLHALFLTRLLSGMAPLDSIVVAADVTGSGVPHALSGRHFSAVTAAGVAVTQGGLVAGLAENVTLLPFPLRDSKGVLRDPSMLDQELFAAVGRSAAAGRHVMLQIMDISKIGGRYPGLNCLRAIQGQFGDAVHIVVDACQMRTSRARLRWHLAQGHMVLISGSKFFTGPPFSGALLVPASCASFLETARQVPPGIQDYTDRSAWPQSWRTLRAAMPARVNFGQYFRWIAALEEMRAYFSIPAGFRCAALHQFADMTTDLIQERYPDFLLLEEWQGSASARHSTERYAEKVDSAHISSADKHSADKDLKEIEEIDDAEMGARTIFPFLVRRGKTWMPFDAAKTLYSALNQDVTAHLPVNFAPFSVSPFSFSPQEKAIASKLCHIGQPVSITQEDGKQAGALRLCASARMVSQLWARNRCDLAAVSLTEERQAISAILEKIALLSRCHESVIHPTLTSISTNPLTNPLNKKAA